MPVWGARGPPGGPDGGRGLAPFLAARRTVECHWLQLGGADALVDGLILSKSERIEVVLGRQRRQLRRQGLARMLDELLQS